MRGESVFESKSVLAHVWKQMCIGAVKEGEKSASLIF